MTLQTYAGTKAEKISQTENGWLYKIKTKTTPRLVHVDHDGVDFETGKKTLYTTEEMAESRNRNLKLAREKRDGSGIKYKNDDFEMGKEYFILSRSFTPKVFQGKMVAISHNENRRKFTLQNKDGKTKSCCTTMDIYSKESLAFYTAGLARVVAPYIAPPELRTLKVKQ